MSTMKKLIATLTFLALGASFTFAQVNARLYTEVTHVSPKLGTAITYSVPGYIGDIELGVFYQKSASEVGDPSEAFQTPYEKEFYGILTSFTMLDKQIFELDIDIRTGMANGSNFVVTPSVRGGLKMGKISLSAGIGTRCFRPTYTAGISVKF
jgi:hypothetical protein